MRSHRSTYFCGVLLFASVSGVPFGLLSGKLHHRPQIIPRGGGDREAVTHHSLQQRDSDLVIIIDVDNTIYAEKDLLRTTGQGIERQIVENTHRFGARHFNLTSEQCDELYRSWGTTIEGLRHTLPQSQVEDTLSTFYEEVYERIDFSCIWGDRKIGDGGESSARSGYDHANALNKRSGLATFLESISRRHYVYLASNSPKSHILRAVRSLGLGNVEFAGILSPDMATLEEDAGDVPFPTKSSPQIYYKPILNRHKSPECRILLLDDSLLNIQLAKSVGIDGIHINRGDRTLEEGLAEALGHIPAGYTFSEVDYLTSKNRVDVNSINPHVWGDLSKRLASRLLGSPDGTVLRVAELGSGLLVILELVVNGGGEGDRSKQSLLRLVAGLARGLKKLEYTAYESNLNLRPRCRQKLLDMGFRQDASDDGTYKRTISFEQEELEINVNLRAKDFQTDESPPTNLDLIIGCSFADLFDPDQLAMSLQRLSRGGDPLVYLPITFSGATQYQDELPRQGLIPSDSYGFQVYSESLRHHGHNLDPRLIVRALSAVGGSLVSTGSSDWTIEPTNEYLWETMLYFFGMSGARDLVNDAWDAAGWMKRSFHSPRTIHVSNEDLLLCMGRGVSRCAENRDYSVPNLGGASVLAQEIQFISPYNVTTVTKETEMSENQVLIESVCSLVSSGTELKIFKGSFDEASLDVNIKGMADETMAYPLSYGYSLVGRVIACGPSVSDSNDLIGRLVFTFSPHATRVIADRDAIQLVPPGIRAEDAVFMPSVETALSLVHDAHVLPGESIAVYGQGIIGLLVTSILSSHSSKALLPFGSITTFDTLGDRLRVSSSLGATSALKPVHAACAGPFDVSIEVSGNPRALQAAIDNTSNNGRVIVGSWYGNSDVALKLGIDFHRSHKTIQTSQVSTIPASLTGLWNKERRFSLTWSLCKALRPSRLISRRMTLDDAQQVYELLDEGKERAICFDYRCR